MVRELALSIRFLFIAFASAQFISMKDPSPRIHTTHSLEPYAAW